MFSVRQSVKFVSNFNCTTSAFLHVQCREPFDLHRRLGLAQLPFLLTCWGSYGPPCGKSDWIWGSSTTGRGFDLLLLQLVDLKLRAQNLGLDLLAAMLPVKRMPREHEHLGEHGSPVCGSAQPSRLCPSLPHPAAPVPTIPAWAPCLRPLTRSTALQGCISLIVRIRRARKPTMPRSPCSKSLRRSLP